MSWPGTVPHACNPSTLGSPRQEDHLSPGTEDQLCNMAKPCLYKEYKMNKHTQKTGWLTPAVLATLEAAVGELLEPGIAKIMPLHASLGNREIPCLK